MYSLFSSIELVNTQEIDLGKAQWISVDYISEGITIRETDGDTLILKEYFNDKNPEYFARVTADETGIAIRYGNRPVIMNSLRGNIELFIPKKFFGVLNVKTISGKLEMAGRFVLSELTLSNTSGRISIGSITSGTVVISTISGSIDIGSMQALANVGTTSGSIRVGDASGDGEYKSVSGAVEVTYKAVTGDITAASTSGRVKLTLPALLSFALKATSVSGRIDVPFKGASLEGGKHAVSGTVGASPQVHVTLRTISGRIDVLPGA